MSPSLTGTKGGDLVNKTQSLRSLVGGNSQRKYTCRIKKSVGFFTKLLHPHTALERPKWSPLMWSPGTNLENQYTVAITLQFLIVEVCSQQGFSQEAQLGEGQATRKQALLRNVWKYMSSLTAQNSSHFHEEAINIHHHKNTLRHPTKSMPYYFSLLFLVEFTLVFLLWYLFIPKKQKNMNATLGITLMPGLSGIHTASALI